ncbi:Bax inhibitor-1/YccA family protein [Parvibium lacunae]|uniref:BAX inhibitor (BI)-1/YccA family protein n=1 Tax=Parvibium lacunae TaxID=1888893 RepID=A0A368L7F1_9BURK|nr:Bax inhibitor-1/YccA family protein [Parvibium lacunae]RCS59544.1 BAX inhibitor (BI)-1/YccA family protein [Parvibium lacunae]
MNQPFGQMQEYGYSQTRDSLLVRNRVLRNTYLLLALSLIPTVLGAWLGIATGLRQVMSGSPILSLIVFLAGAFGFMFAIEKNKNSSLGVVLLLGFTLFMGIMLSRLVGSVLGLANGAQLIMMAFGGTAAIFGVMATIATVSKRNFSGLGKWLFVGALVLLVASVIGVVFQLSAMMIAMSVLAIAIFSLYMLYDVNQIVNGGETNYISATLALYLDIYNVFSNLLALLGIFGGDRE